MTLTITFASLLTIALWEFWRPRRAFEFPTLRRRFGNLGIWLGSILAAALIFPRQPALFAWPIADPVLGFVTAFLLLDFLSYAVHRAQHVVPILWRCHALHHSDPDVDFSTSVRHHPAELLINSSILWLAILVLGIPAKTAATYSTAAFVLAALTHANTRWPGWIERLARPMLITLDLHLVHHSIDPRDLNRNFGEVFSVWDRLFGTLAQRPAAQLTFGVTELSRRDACRPSEMLLTPWRLSMPNITHRLPDGREIEASWQIRGDRLRLRARLVDTNGLVVESLMRDYAASDPSARAAFQAEFEGITGIAIGGPLFPQALRAAA